jgi:excisionase family DNA binding protein
MEIKPLFVTPAEAAKMLSVSRSKLYVLIREGKVPSRKIGASIRVPLQALEKMAIEAANRIEVED